MFSLHPLHALGLLAHVYIFTGHEEQPQQESSLLRLLVQRRQEGHLPSLEAALIHFFR